MSRAKRQAKILDLIKRYVIDTQEELVERLKSEDFSVTQATISRDIKELSLTKILTEQGKYKYIQIENDEQKVSGKVVNMFRDSVVSIDFAENLIVIKTLSGTANAAALLIDKLALSEVLGCIAGDDTFLVVAKSKNDAENVVLKLREVSGI